jgi:hypothetical protein
MKVSNTITTGAQLLLNLIWWRFGGPAKLTKVHFPELHRQNWVNWRERGNVPLKLVYTIANRLKIPVWGLNYEELAVMMPDDIPPWRDVVASYGFSKYEISRVLYLKPPKGGPNAINIERQKNNEKYGKAVRSEKS